MEPFATAGTQSNENRRPLSLARTMADGKMYKPVAANDPLQLEMMKCEKANPVAAIVKSGRAVLGPKGELPTSNRMPIYEPLVCASFAAKNLAGDRSRGGNDSQAGRDPWSICDYLRDSLQWPASFIFIDAEQTGMYDLDMYHFGPKHCAECKRNPPKRPTADGARNWKSVFTWAQEKSKVMLYFISEDFLERTNCINEIKDFSMMLNGGNADAAVLFALLDPGLTSEAKKLMRELGTQASEGGMADRVMRVKFSVDNVFDLSDYMIWDDARREGRGGHKLDLRAAAKGMVQLRAKVFDLCGGMGDRDAYMRDVAQGLACDDVADDKGAYVRNRYRDDVRRIDINNAEVDTLRARVPHVGEVRADEIMRLRRKLGGISSIEQLAQIDGLKLGGETLSDMEPFLTFKSAQGGARSPATTTKPAPPTAAPTTPIKMPPLPSPAKPSRAELDKLKMDDLKALAAKRGITPDGDKRKKDTWIDALL